MISDEQALPRAQPRHHRGDQPCRDRGADPGRLPRPGPAADRRRRHLLRRRSARPAASRPTTRSGSPASASARSRRSSSTATTCRSPSGSTATPSSATETAAAIKVKTLLGRDVPLAAAGRVRSAGRGRGDPGRAHQLAVRRRRGVLRSGRDLRADRHRPARAVADDAGRPHPQHPRGVPRGARRGLPAVGQRRREGRADQRAARQPRAGLEGPRRARPGHHRADEGQRRAVPRPGRPSRRRAPPAGLDLARCPGSSPPWSSRAATTSSPP